MTDFTSVPAHLITAHLPKESLAALSSTSKSVHLHVQSDVTLRRERKAFLDEVERSGTQCYLPRALADSVSHLDPGLAKGDAARLISERLRSVHDAYTNPRTQKYIYEGDAASGQAAYATLRNSGAFTYPIAHFGIAADIHEPAAL